MSNNSDFPEMAMVESIRLAEPPVEGSKLKANHFAAPPLFAPAVSETVIVSEAARGERPAGDPARLSRHNLGNHRGDIAPILAAAPMLLSRISLVANSMRLARPARPWRKLRALNPVRLSFSGLNRSPAVGK